MFDRRLIIISLLIFGVVLVGMASAQTDDEKTRDCVAGVENTYVERIIDNDDCDAQNQEEMESHISNLGYPQYSIEDETLNYGESTQVRVEVLHDDPNVNYDCQIRTTNNGNQNRWTDFHEVEREELSSDPTTITQSITAPERVIPEQETVTVQVEVYCYGPADEVVYDPGIRL